MKITLAPIMVEIMTAAADKRFVSDCGVRVLTFKEEGGFTEFTIDHHGKVCWEIFAKEA